MAKKRIKSIKDNIKDFIHKFITALRRPDMVVLPGSLAFYFFLAIIPSVGLISYGASILNLSVDYIYEFVASSFSTELADLILSANISSQTGIHFLTAIVVGLYVASNGANSIITSSNAIYGIKNSSWIKRRIKALGMTFLMVVLLIFMLVVPVFGDSIIILFEDVNLNSEITANIVAIFELLEGPLSWIIMFLIISIIYRIAPDKKTKGSVINYGAIFATAGFVIGTKIYSIYATNYASYQTLYGGLANIVLLMIWVYYLSYIFTIGMALNVQKDEDKLTKTGTIETDN